MPKCFFNGTSPKKEKNNAEMNKCNHLLCTCLSLQTQTRKIHRLCSCFKKNKQTNKRRATLLLIHNPLICLAIFSAWVSVPNKSPPTDHFVSKRFRESDFLGFGLLRLLALVSVYSFLTCYKILLFAKPRGTTSSTSCNKPIVTAI